MGFDTDFDGDFDFPDSDSRLPLPDSRFPLHAVVEGCGREEYTGSMSVSGSQIAAEVYEASPIHVLRGRSRYHPSTQPRGEYRRRGKRWKRWVLWISIVGLAGTMWVAYRAAQQYPSTLKLPTQDARVSPLELK